MASARRMRSAPTTIRAAVAALRGGTTTSVELTTAALERAQRLDATLGCFIARFDDAALSQAAHADEELACGHDRGPLHGIPVGVKDVIAAREAPTTAQSIVLDPTWSAGRDAPVVARLRTAGGVLVGKTTLPEFAFGAFEPGQPFPVPRNPWDPQRWPGGSSSGTAVGLAADFFLAGIGSDTGGSIRIPAALTGTTGLMPTYSLVPKSGCVPLGFSLDRIGPMAHSAWDCAAILSVIAGHHATDPMSSREPVANYLAEVEQLPGPIRIGVVRARRPTDDTRIDACFEEALATLARAGATITDVALPLRDELDTARLVTVAAEAYAYHERDLAGHWSDYSAPARYVLALGALVTARDYVQAQRLRRSGERALQRLFVDVDVIASPTISALAPRYSDFDARWQSVPGRYETSYWNAVSNPALALPIGFVDELPASMQLSGRPYADGTLLHVADRYQRLTDWHTYRPTTIEPSSKEDADGRARGAPHAAVCRRTDGE